MILPYGNSMLNYSVEQENLNFIRALVKANKGCKGSEEIEIPFIRNFEGVTPLHRALDETKHN